MTETPGNKGTAGSQASDAPSLEELARRLLDLWQDQLTAVAANPDLATQAARLMAAMPLPGMWLGQMGQMGPQAGTPDIAKAWAEMARTPWMNPGATQAREAAAKGEPGHASRASGDNAATAAPAGTAPATAASQPGGGDLDELGRRLAGIEKRLAELAGERKPRAARVGRTGRKPAAKRGGKPRASG